MKMLRKWLAEISFRLAGLEKRGRPDPQALFADLAHVHGSQDYADIDRYRDFREVFLNTARGQRVLHEILSWACMFRPVFVPGDAYATHYRDGERGIALQIMAVLNAAPGPTVIEADSEKPIEE